jgi:hypothetical protein
MAILPTLIVRVLWIATYDAPYQRLPQGDWPLPVGAVPYPHAHRDYKSLSNMLRWKGWIKVKNPTSEAALRIIEEGSW